MAEILKEKQAAEYVGVKLNTFRQWRQRGTGPVFARLNNRTIRYDKSDIDSWLESKKGGRK